MNVFLRRFSHGFTLYVNNKFEIKATVREPSRSL